MIESERDKASGISVFCRFDALEDITKLIPNPKNPNKHPDDQVKLLAKIIQAQGWRQPITVSSRSGFIVKGHGRLMAAQVMQIEKVPVEYQHYENEAQEYADLIADNRLAELSKTDLEEVSDLLQDQIFEDFDIELTGFDPLEFNDNEEETQIDVEDAPEVAPSVCSFGDIWQLGSHRIGCLDSTDSNSYKKLMNGNIATLLHADPPYGMGKEKDGVKNDNLYNEELDAFQMSWWRAARPFLSDKASAYIWGQAPQLWRLWYKAGLEDSECFQFRNEIVWDKKNVSGMKSDHLLQYPEASERVLFFQFGKQFVESLNSKDFPEQLQVFLDYQLQELKKSGATRQSLKDLLGVDMFGHWFSTSQFQMIPEKHYLKLQENFSGCFEKPHSELKKEWAELRSYFDNGHDVMRDVWEFSRVSGKERYGHATPKPVDMMVRIMKTSCPKGEMVLEPFLGSGSTLMGAEVSGRVCYGLELKPEYCDIVIKRWQDHTGEEAIKVSE